MRQGVACCLDPFTNIGIPEYLRGRALFAPRDRQRRHWMPHCEGVEHVEFYQLAVLAWNCVRQYRFQPLTPEFTFKFDI